MAKQMIGSFYPRCHSQQTSYNKSDSLDGKILIEDGMLQFRRMFLSLFHLKNQDVYIPLEDIVKVEAMNLNGIMPFGVCVYTDTGKEYMFGHIKNKKLQAFITEALKEKS